MRQYYYVYETTLRNGLKYIGYRKSRTANPYHDIYYGSPRKPDSDWKPTSKRIIAVLTNKEDALTLEIYLHKKYDVARSPKYYNKARQTSVKCAYDQSKLRLWFHPLHGEFLGTPSDIVRCFANFNYQRANLTRLATLRQTTPYRGWIYIHTFNQ